MIRGKNQASHALLEQALCAGKKVAFADARGSWYITRTNGVTTWTPVPITYERRLPELVIYDEADDFDAKGDLIFQDKWTLILKCGSNVLNSKRHGAGE